MPTQVPASDPPFYGIFVPKALLLKNFNEIIAARDLHFGLPPILNPGYAYVPRQCFFLTLITFDCKQSFIIVFEVRLRDCAQNYLNTCGESVSATI